MWSKPAWVKARPYLQNNESKKASGMAEAVEHPLARANTEFKPQYCQKKMAQRNRQK
jgi:hypothetical protein